MTEDLAWLRTLGVPVEMLAERIGRTPAVVTAELETLEAERTTTVVWEGET